MTDIWRWMPVAVSQRAWRCAVALLLTALVLVQTVGVVHRVVHAQHTHAALMSPKAGDTASTTDVSPFARLWGEHSSWAQCQLLDQAAPDLLHSVSAATLGFSLLPMNAAEVVQEPVAQAEYFFSARGPPAPLI